METSLFTAQSVGRLLDCTDVDSAFKALTDMGFGAGTAVGNLNFDGLFAAEENRAVDFLKEFNVDGALDVFLAEYDFLNLKAIFKSSITGKPAVTAPSGLYGTDEIKGWLSDDKADIPACFAEAVRELKRLAAGESVSPYKVDCIVNRAQYGYVFSKLKKGDKLTREYFVKKMDTMNVGAFLRCKKLGLAKNYFADGFIEGGELAFLPEIYDMPLDALKERCKRTAYEEWVTKLVDDGDFVAYEVAVDNALLKLWKDEKDDMFSVAPIVSFYLTKITQIRVAKLAVAGIKNGVEQSKIRERMRELYA